MDTPCPTGALLPMDYYDFLPKLYHLINNNVSLYSALMNTNIYNDTFHSEGQWDMPKSDLRSQPRLEIKENNWTIEFGARLALILLMLKRY